MSLTFGYSTLSSRLENIQLPDLSNHPDWMVLITVQSGDSSEPKSSRAPGPARVLGFPGRGVTKLRNAVIQNSDTDYLIFADDDVIFNLENIELAIQHMKKTGLGLLLGQAIDETGKLRKSYPTKLTRLNKINSAKAATYEMLIDLRQIKASGVLFDEAFGAGAETTYLGDEYIFICDLVSKGVICEFVPITLAVHPKDSSGSGWGTDRDRRARALIFDRAFKGNRTLPYLVRIGFGLRKLGKELSFGNYLKFIFKK
ncbi:MAG: glycosyltransferase [Micrococcales bacterium]|nr:glycosyltransferase [Micrococcales bacterium]NBR61164.1 glycosyltransferase [Actinomycetota bacterium]NBR55015.1 glycosyltransferase [Micrococcales bacterium]NBT47407.1 glycosyltransferase [Actinomycetota bacterium]NBY43311.1 glycosyltransferase [Micrococcales bacterium]